MVTTPGNAAHPAGPPLADQQSSRDGTSNLHVYEDQCHLLLGAVPVARIAFVDDGLPQIVVMNHRRDGDDVLLRTSEDTRLAALTRDGRALAVALEVDKVSAAGQFGWSVIASGSLARDDGVATGRLPQPWRGGTFPVGLRLRIEQISGLQVGSDSDHGGS